jgi:hypothetical protein
MEPTMFLGKTSAGRRGNWRCIGVAESRYHTQASATGAAAGTAGMAEVIINAKTDTAILRAFGTGTPTDHPRVKHNNVSYR